MYPNMYLVICPMFFFSKTRINETSLPCEVSTYNISYCHPLYAFPYSKLTDHMTTIGIGMKITELGAAGTLAAQPPTPPTPLLPFHSIHCVQERNEPCPAVCRAGFGARYLESCYRYEKTDDILT